MNKILFSSKKMNWETPQYLFDELNAEFNFKLDAAADKSNAKCSMFYTEQDNGLLKSWDVRGLFSAILHTAEMYMIG